MKIKTKIYLMYLLINTFEYKKINKIIKINTNLNYFYILIQNTIRFYLLKEKR